MSSRGCIRMLLAAFLAAVAGLLLAGCAGTSTQAPSTGPTQPRSAHLAAAPSVTAQRIFHAYGADGRPAVAIAHTVSGYCWNSSLATTSRDAFRCFSGNAILDPCFAPAVSTVTSMVCVPDPWSKATLLHLTSALPASQASGATRPWALELRTGAHCVASTGTVPDVAGVTLSFHCSDGTAAAIVGASTPVITADYARPSAATVQRTDVTTVWRS